MKVIIYKDRRGEWRWRMMKKGRIVAESGEGYTRASDASRALKGVMKSIWSGRLTFEKK